MSNSFAERLIEAMKGPPKVSGVALAKACGVAPPSISDWRTGATKSPDGSHLLAAAKKLGVRPEWLADGIGPKYPNQTGSTVVAMEEGPQYIRRNPFDIWTTEAIAIMEALPANHKQGALANLRTYVHNLEPPLKKPKPAPSAAAA